MPRPPTPTVALTAPGDQFSIAIIAPEPIGKLTAARQRIGVDYIAIFEWQVYIQ